MALFANECPVTICLIILLTMATNLEAGKVLLFPYGHGFTSRLADMRNMGNILIDAGHDVTYLINEEDRRHLDAVLGANFHTYPVPAGRVVFIENESKKSQFLKKENNTQALAGGITDLMAQHVPLCEELLKKREILDAIKTAKYDLFINDFADSCGRVLTIYFGIPTMTYSSTGLVVDQILFPNIGSIVPAPFSPFTSSMTFMERVKNTLIFTALHLLVGPYYFGAFEDLQQKYDINQNSEVSLSNAYAHQMMVSHTDFVLEEPRPLLPNVILVGGMHILKTKPLDKRIIEFIDGAGEKGFVLVSFGSLIDRMEPEKSELIAKVLAKLNHRVIWRVKGKPPKNVGANTLLLPWLPQNDLLAHPKIKVFVTHCGIHGTYETLHHGVPVVAVPLMFDQYDNAKKITKNAKMGIYIDFKTMTEKTLFEAITEVISDPKHKAMAVYNSQLLQDHPLPAKDRFLFYTDYMIRHKGIGRMKLEPMAHLNSFQLYCLDVWGFIIIVAVCIMVVSAYILRALIRCCCAFRNKSGKKKAE